MLLFLNVFKWEYLGALNESVMIVLPRLLLSLGF